MLENKAYSEVYYVIQNLTDEQIKKIPLKIVETIKNKMNMNYYLEIKDTDIKNMKLMEDAEKILSVIYTDYLASEEERRIILNKERIIEIKKELEKKEKYDTNIFKRKK